jgi:hypothetical protein
MSYEYSWQADNSQYMAAWQGVFLVAALMLTKVDVVT